jgi:hypothetical protein
MRGSNSAFLEDIACRSHLSYERYVLFNHSAKWELNVWIKINLLLFVVTAIQPDLLMQGASGRSTCCASGRLLGREVGLGITPRPKEFWSCRLYMTWLKFFICRKWTQCLVWKREASTQPHQRGATLKESLYFLYHWFCDNSRRAC